MSIGKLVISLDFELHWGAPEIWNLKERKSYFEETRKSIPIVLDLFEKYKIHATWATVGFLFAKNKMELKNYCPDNKPTYNNSKLNYYNLIDNSIVGNNEDEDPFHFGHSLISKILKTPYQELATHTFAHYYCNEKGQTVEQFDADLKATQAIAQDNFGIKLKSLVFPRNQFNSKYLKVAFNNGIKVVRSNPDVWFWNKTNFLSPIFRALDTLFAISAPLSYKINRNNEVLLLPASRFLRAYSKKEKIVQNLKLSRIKKEMLYAAKHKKIYHLWWHPHNFGYSLKDNLIFLENILNEYKRLNKKYGFESTTMIDML